MNAGITDAIALGKILAKTLDLGPSASPDLLGEYGQARRPVAEQVIGLSSGLFAECIDGTYTLSV